MSADSITYCLEQLSDYRQFERLCSALLAGAGYSTIDPLGGTGDEGRDAIIRADSAGRTICFAYTVRTDWRIKLRSDCKRVNEAGHTPDIFVFACTEAIAARDKDAAVQMVQEDFGWRLDLFDLERLRVQLSGPQRHLLAQHPS
ncbi:MAG TPA: restriction endonuclease, partial [Acidovorax sp.]|nr:restriction endonuclease [Acidovorax sp.]